MQRPTPLREATADAAGAILTIDLDAVARNYSSLAARAAGGCAAVVKADGYGLGALKVGPRLAAEGCRDFFVAHLSEGAALKPLLPEDARLHVLHGPMPGAETELHALSLIPVLNSLEQLAAWSSLAQRLGTELPAILQVDTGMSRMGLSPEEARLAASDKDRLSGVKLSHVMSHLASADDPADPTNAMQLANFQSIRAMFPGVRASLANSSGMFLGSDYHVDLSRPGVALYGVNPTPGAPNPMRPVVSLSAKVVNIRTIPAHAGVGYALSWRAPAEARIATIAIGYADGFLRSLSNSGSVFVDGVKLPIAGRVSMDSVGVDASALPEGRLNVGDFVDVLGPGQDVDSLAAAAGTVGYEILTNLGRRFHRRHVGDGRPQTEET